MNKQKRKAFTLVELIIVITILSILWVLWFISFQKYILQSKNTKIVSSLHQVEKTLITHFVKTWKYPIPDNSTSIFLSGNLVSSQGIVWENLSQILNIQLSWENPIYYSTASHQKWYQLLSPKYTALNNTFSSITYAEDVSYFSIWNEVWYLLLEENVTPSQIEINDLTEDNIKLILNDTNIITHRDEIKKSLENPNSCLRMQQTGIISKSWWYNITWENQEQINVYCNIDSSHDWWWALLASIPWDSRVFADRSSSWIWKSPKYDFENPNWLENREYLSPAYEKFRTNEILLCYEDTQTCYNFKHNRNIPFYHFFRDNISHIEYVNNLVWYADEWSLEKLQNYFSTFLWTSQVSYGNCNFLWINYRINNTNSSSMIIWLWWDNDGPCISRNNSTSSTLDNYLLWIAGYLWPYWHLNFNEANPTYRPAWAQWYNIKNSTPVQIHTSTTWLQTSYISKNWFIFWR